MNTFMKNLIEYNGIDDFFPKYCTAFKTIVLEDNISISAPFHTIDTVSKFTCTPNMVNMEFKKSPVGISINGQILSGNIIMFDGYLKNVFEYSSNQADDTIQVFEFTKAFSDYIVLSDDYAQNPNITIVPYIHDINIIEVTENSFCYSIILGINAEFSE